MGCSSATTTTFQVPAYVLPTPAKPASVTVDNIKVTGADDWTADIDWTAVTGATSGYKIFVDGTQVGTAPAGTTSGNISGHAPGQSHTAGVEACNS